MTIQLYGVQGAGIVAAGNAMQFSAHKALASLSSAASSTRKEEYRIPKGVGNKTRTLRRQVGMLLKKCHAFAGGAFELVSCPHYFAEIVIYGGFVVLLGAQSTTVWLIFLWVVSAVTKSTCAMQQCMCPALLLYRHFSPVFLQCSYTCVRRLQIWRLQRTALTSGTKPTSKPILEIAKHLCRGSIEQQPARSKLDQQT